MTPVQFLQTLVAFLHTNNVLPAEVTTSDINREKTYLQDLPATPDRVYGVRIYDTALPTLVAKQAGIYYIQVIMRNTNHASVLADITTLWHFLINRPAIVEDISTDCWVIFDVRNGPIQAGRDEKGRYLYTLNFAVKTRMF